MPPSDFPVLEKATGALSSPMPSVPVSTSTPKSPSPSRMALLLMEDLVEELLLDQAHACHLIDDSSPPPLATESVINMVGHVSPNIPPSILLIIYAPPPPPRRLVMVSSNTGSTPSSTHTSPSLPSPSPSSSSMSSNASSMANQPIPCLNCDRSVASPRWAAHLEKCLGLSSGRTGSSRSVVRRAAQVQRDAGSFDRGGRTPTSSRSPSLGPSHPSVKRVRHTDGDLSGDFSDSDGESPIKKGRTSPSPSHPHRSRPSQLSSFQED
ncbi:hypothetical protein BJ684DRAFT_16379 [Piptocephalis cylindrospora]|uniref:SAGA-associated factor 11 n=1 Tax=Piptocephalis cylindrospora TaxID=1907219 RepID=A0A4P9Y3I5_9FUNG|nr:hypothetical protein BJ684DRAFT_16379 [Piptocephalis cylindrospora]|eukprot:RKP13202.1 hypothetical protein BJ684DRAFT_16379 [Piptocephalis cylindrospora]